MLNDNNWVLQPFDAEQSEQCDDIVAEMLPEEELFTDDMTEEDCSNANTGNEVYRGDNGSNAVTDCDGSSHELLDEAMLAINNVLPLKSEEGQSVSDESEKKFSPTINGPDYGRQYKSTLVKLLNEDGPKLSHDRLRQHNSEKQYNQSSSHESQIQLFEDYAFLNTNKDMMSFGRVVRTRKKMKNAFVEYRNAVDFKDPSLKALHVVFNEYESVKKTAILEIRMLCQIKVLK